MRVSVVGTGYVGLVTGACLAERGVDVTCVDLDRRRVDTINRGEAPFHEEGLPELLRSVIGTKLRATVELTAAVRDSDVTLVAVGTPARDGRIDLSYVEQAARDIGAALARKDGYHVVVVKSTVVPGTTDGVVRKALEEGSGKRAGADFGLGMNPEFLTEGTAIDDFRTPDRLVLGGIDERTHECLVALYESFPAAVPRILTNPSTAEMIKYASNALLATLISFSNELARLSSAVGNIDALEVMRGVHKSAYLTHRGKDGAALGVAPIAGFLEAGCGFGGSCLPKDVTAIAAQGKDLGVPMPLLTSVLEINAGQPREMIRLLEKHVPDLRGKRVAVLGLAFKQDTDDTRESPAFPVIEQLRAAGARVTAYDPVARPVGHERLAGVLLANDLRGAVEGADAVLIVTRWKEFEQLPAVLADLRQEPIVVDGRRILAPTAVRHYEGIGR
ncbi:MAG TPA: UDP-glucose/GDP-mannose dehydrogenase family protein [Gammaproteobacteria bacterium]|nr:UDP-glucose/GDP-mannose dehydrogenase family protein [Gammaproteobacteria bacterium]